MCSATYRRPCCLLVACRVRSFVGVCGELVADWLDAVGVEPGVHLLRRSRVPVPAVRERMPSEMLASTIPFRAWLGGWSRSVTWPPAGGSALTARTATSTRVRQCMAMAVVRCRWGWTPARVGLGPGPGGRVMAESAGSASLHATGACTSCSARLVALPRPSRRRRSRRRHRRRRCRRRHRHRCSISARRAARLRDGSRGTR
jgi:hypothetical protein